MNNILTAALFGKVRWIGLFPLLLALSGCVRRMPENGISSPLLTSQPSLVAPILPAASATPSQKPASSASLPQATPSPSAAGPTSTPDLENYNRQAWSDTSPYGRWQAIFGVDYPENPDGSPIGDKYHVHIGLIDLNSGNTSSILDEWRPYGQRYTIPQALLWSNDSRYLILAETGNSDGSGERFYQQLQRYDLLSDQLTSLDLPGGQGESVSPDGKYLALIETDRLVLIEIETGQKDELLFDLPPVEWRTGQIFWSPQSEAILFTLRLNPFAPVETMSSNLYWADLGSGQVKTLIENDRRRFAIRSFPESSTALLSDLEARDWWLTLPDGSIQPGPPQDIARASQALQSYFKALQSGLYNEAINWYGGSYAPLQNLNPDIPQDDSIALFSRACTSNGYQCLAVDSLLLEQVTQAGKFLFEVSFTDPEGKLFVLNPCCGGSLETQPPTWLFQFSVKQDASGRYTAQELPVFSP